MLDAQETRAIATITAAATAADPLEAARQALDAFLDQCCDPVYGRLVWLEGPAALGWHRWRECEQKYAFGLVERFITALVGAGYMPDRAVGSLVRFCFWMLGGAGLALAEAPEADQSPAARGVALPDPADHLRPPSWIKGPRVTYSQH